MKRILLLIIAVVCIAGCNKENDPKEDDRLVGTTFRTDAYKSLMGPVFGYQYHLYDFTSTSEGVAYWADKNGNQNGSDGNITYRLEYPELFITDDGGEETHFRFIDARAFSLVKVDGTLNNSFTYYKQ